MTDYNKIAHYTVFVNFSSNDGKQSELNFLRSLRSKDRQLLGWCVTDPDTNETDAGFMTTKIDIARRIQDHVRSILNDNNLLGEVEIGHWEKNVQNLKAAV